MKAQRMMLAILILISLSLVSLTGVFAQGPEEGEGFVLPVNPLELPNALPGGVANEAPDTPACTQRMDLEEPCSSLEGQAVAGSFTLGGEERPELRLHNGDVIEVMDASGVPLFPRIPTEVSGTNHDLVVLYSTEGAAAVNLQVNAEFGSNRQNFYASFPRRLFSDDDVTGIVAHQLRLILVQSDPALQAWMETNVEDADGPYPEINPANCSAVEDLEDGEVTYCDTVNVYVFQWDGTTWQPRMYGVYGLLRDENGVATEAAYMDLTSRMTEFAQEAQQ